MSYQPNPVDTSHIDLGQLGGLSEYLAEQVHEVWSKARMQEGWTYGPVRNDELKQHPDLRKYSEIPDTEREYDRKVSSHTLKLILDRGFELVPKDAEVATLRGEGPPEPDEDDMVDERELQWLKSRVSNGENALIPLVEQLQWLGEELGPTYREADRAAEQQQKVYLRASFWCLASAMVAVFLAIYQLATFHRMEELPLWLAKIPLLLPVAELVLVLIAVTMVLLEFQNNWKDSWLTNRSRAERLRALKFRTLLDPDAWSSATSAETKAKVRRMVREIQSMSPEHLWAKLADADLDPRVPDRLTGIPETDHDIGNYYLRRRLIVQSRYAGERARDYHHADQRTRLIGPILFFGVLIFVFAHDVAEMSHPRQGSAQMEVAARGEANPQGPLPSPDKNSPDDDFSDKAGRWLIGLAAALPAASAALHVYRDGREAARNHVRTVATQRRLSILHGHFEGLRTRKEQIRLMIETETVLADEHEQWLQLMKECEWFG